MSIQAVSTIVALGGEAAWAFPTTLPLSFPSCFYLNKTIYHKQCTIRIFHTTVTALWHIYCILHSALTIYHASLIPILCRYGE